MIHHKQLLEKYIRWIRYCEGTDYVNGPHPCGKCGTEPPAFTEDELDFFEMVLRMEDAGDYDEVTG